MSVADLAATTARHRSATLAGIGLMLAGIMFFALNDALGKWLVATYGVGQILLLRSLAALALLVVLLRSEGLASLGAVPRPGLQLLRVAFATAEVACFYWAVAYLPLADVMTYYLAGPVYVAALAPLLLGERLEPKRAAAVALGFIGVLIALRPSSASLSLPALVALAGSVIFALFMLTTRALRGTSDAALVLGQTLGALALGAVMAPFAWVTPSPLDFGLLSLLGLVAMGAHMCVNRSLKLAPASVVTPYQYTLIVWAALLGYIFFGDVIGTWTLVGAGVIVAAGLLLIALERGADRTPPGLPTDV